MESLLVHKIIPVLTVNDPDVASAAVAALQEGGIECVEVALRTDNALAVLESLCQRFPELMIGAGTLRRPEEFNRVTSAGARFAVSPGSTAEMLQESTRWDIPYLPAAATVSEILNVTNLGFSTVKIFPAETLGGCQFIKDVSAPLSNVSFVPSGGINLQNCASYLSLDSVAAVSGSWMLTGQLLADKNFAEVTRLTKTSLEILRQS